MDIIEKLNQKARLARQLGNHVPDNPIIAKLNARARRRKAADAWPESNPHTANTCATAPETSSSQSTDKERSSSATSVDGADAASTEERRNETLPPGGLLQAGDSAEAPNAYNANTMNNKRQRRAAVLPWMRVPVSVDAGSGVPLCDVGSLLPKVRDALAASGIRELFPVQSAVWKHLGGGLSDRHDLAVCAPTGSGKTLAYALPLIHRIARMHPAPSAPRAPRRVRGLVVVPTRDLARQVHGVLGPLCRSVGLSVALAAGAASLHAEAEDLVAPCGWGKADVVVATPGRLSSHLRATPGFDLADLAFLIVDEADRLLRQSYQEWLPRVLAAVGPSLRVLKVVASATLTRDPSKISRLGLITPRYVAVTGEDQRYVLPKNLSEFKVVCLAALKPHTMLCLLQRITRAPSSRVMVFASSVEAAHRLATMLACMHRVSPSEAPSVVEFSSAVSNAERAHSLELFRKGTARVMVASDAATRGIDVEGVTAVVNYDPPVFPKTYVHRAGRTARAGKAGEVYTILRPEDVWHFKNMLRKADNNFVRDVRIPREKVEELKEAVEGALREMQQVLMAKGGKDSHRAHRGMEMPSVAAAVRDALLRKVDKARYDAAMEGE